METCCWCTPIDSVVTTLKNYAYSLLSPERFAAANEDLCFCLECVDEYHKVKDDWSSLHEILWNLETTRLIAHFEKSMPKEKDDSNSLDCVEGERVQCLDSDIEKKLRVPLLEILKYPYLLLHKQLSMLFVDAICKMEAINYPCQVLGKHPGVYLLMVHPNETIRRWAIMTAKSLGKVDRDDYYDIQEVLNCLLRVIELNLFENAYVYNPTTVEKGNLILLPDHLYDITSYKNYWLGICMVLLVLDEQAMDSLLLGPNKQNDFMQCIINTLKKDSDDESNSPFWPALHCFMVILDKLGSKVWGQHIDPSEAFQTINNSVSYNKEIENIRQRCKRTRSVPLSDCEDEMVTCSQLVYDYRLEKPQKVTRQKSAACPNYFPDLYEDMKTLIDAFQADFGQDIQLHSSTFLWLIPFIHSLMGLRELGIGYSVQVVSHLCLKTDVSENSAESYDKVSQFFIWVLVIVIQLHLKKKCLSSLWVSAEKWVRTVVAWAKLPRAVFMAGIERRAARSCLISTATSPSLETESVQSFCMKLIRNILKEGLHDVKTPVCKQFFLELNLLLRNRMNLELSPKQTQELQSTLKHIIRTMWMKSGPSSPMVESFPIGVNERQEDMHPVNMCNEHPPHLSAARKDEVCQEGEVQEGSMLANRYMYVQKTMSCHQILGIDIKVENIWSGVETPRASSPLMTKNDDSSDALEKSVDQNDLTSQRKRLRPLSPIFKAKLRQLLNKCRSSTMLKSKTKKEQSVRDQRKSQEGPKSDIVAGSAGNTSDSLLCKSGAGSSKSFLSLSACMKNKCKDGLVNFETGHSDSEEGSSDDMKEKMPLDIVVRNQQNEFEAAVAVTSTSTATDPQINIVVNKGTKETPVDSRQESSKKVMGSVQSQSSSEDYPSKAAKGPIHTIIISDSSEEDENQGNTSTESRQDTTCVRHEKQSSAQGQEPMNSSPTNAEHESQLFEFESEAEIYSEWQDSQTNEETTEEENLLVETDNGHRATDLEINYWGYESNPHWFNATEEAKEDPVQNSETKTKPHTPAQKVNISSRNAMCCSTSTGMDAGCSRHIDPSAPTAPSESASAVKESTIQPKKAPPQAEPARSTPTVVPPAKVHHFPPPTSLTENLGLSKKVRRAAELSQRTQDSLAELRRHGEIAGRVDVAQKRTSQLINASHLTTKNRKMLSCQELQFYRQTRPKEREKGQHTQRGNPSSSILEATASKTNPLTSTDSSSSSCDEDVALKEGEPQLNENIEDDNLFLTQSDPVDMELCSQIESGSNPTHMEVSVSASPLQDANEICKEAGSKGAAEAEAHGASCSAGSPQDNASAKTFAPPRLSTMKIFSVSSRNANLTKELESIPKPPAVPKSKSYSFMPPTSKGNGLQSQIPMPNSILQPQNSNNVPQLLNVQNNSNVYTGGVLPASRPVSWHEMNPRFTQANSVNAQQRSPAIFSREILKWNYDMFAQFSQFGPPAYLLQSVMTSVPATFNNYNDYFNTFFPLMMLNTFETVAQDWIENQKWKDKRNFHLTLLNFSLDTNEADFTANLSESNLGRQYPKQDDFVVLTVYEKQAFHSNPHEAESRPVCHVGCVTRFYFKYKEQDVVNLSVKTQGNLSRIEKKVMCLTVCSLSTMQRMFKALLLLNRSPLAKAIISTEYSDFSLMGSKVDSENSSSYMREFNEDQRTAIETAYALVTQSPSLPKICLIHGPPGSGKSKTILGLLYCLFIERPGKENSVQSKIKNRVLLCAPSNAAVDDLMKKIILMFKGKCQDSSSPLGNCGDINLVRLGQESSISRDVWKFSLDAQVDHEISKAALGRHQDICKRKEDLDRQLDIICRQRAIAKTQSAGQLQLLDKEICRLGEERKRLTVQLKKDCGRSQGDLKANIILKSHIICCTLSTSGSSMLASAFRRQGCDPLSCVIVDEAAQSCEMESLIPLTHGCKKLVLVGDPKQLPPTVKSMTAEEYGYGQSLMERLCRQLDAQLQNKVIDRLPVLRLTTQYRMHPDICLFPSNYVYNRALKTDMRTEENRFSKDWPFVPYLLFDVLDAHEIRESDSFVNLQEVKLVVELITLITKTKKSINYRNIGIITPYSAQKRRILLELEKEFGREEKGVAEVDTVDGFQGREKDCIIVSCVRAQSTQGSIGFLKSLQRLNVTLTRAKYSLFILGHLKTLMENKDWNALIQDAQKRGSIIKTTSKTLYNSIPCYATGAKMILKPTSVQQRLTRATIGQVTTVATSGEAPAKHPQPSSSGAPAPAPTPGSSRESPAQAQPSLVVPRFGQVTMAALMNEVPVQHPQPSSSGAPAPRNNGAPLMTASGHSSSSNPQATSQNRPRDPRLAKRAEEGVRRSPTESHSPTDPKRQKKTE
ncbi:probable helicase senataxin [Podarcis raffonei]|uniref:probable helicase senataxin n=1 Tax=Podarcis raffonei TaxID=65483 RepID=UPI0023296A54|nr:probable helicase senataxin [Podarcis raffonei]